jgi:hypothetical protein
VLDCESVLRLSHFCTVDGLHDRRKQASSHLVGGGGVEVGARGRDEVDVGVGEGDVLRAGAGVGGRELELVQEWGLELVFELESRLESVLELDFVLGLELGLVFL